MVGVLLSLGLAAFFGLQVIAEKESENSISKIAVVSDSKKSNNYDFDQIQKKSQNKRFCKEDLMADIVDGYRTNATANLAKVLSSSLYPNDFSKNIAKTWMRNASEYIFHDDLRSFLEIVVNACDATVEAAGFPEYAVGKFGMGFCSIFSLLKFTETFGTRIILKTCYKNEKLEYNSYSLSFSSVDNNDVAIDYRLLPYSEKTGTFFEILPNKGNFSQETLKRIAHYLYYLDFYPHVKTNLRIISSHGIEENVTIGGKKSALTINVLLSPEKISVEDSGLGIAKSCAFSTLIVPSSSTKGLVNFDFLQKKILNSEAVLPELRVWQGKENKNKSYFIIAVNGVIVIDKLLEQVIESDGKIVDIIVHMPQITQLTLARNELAITADGLSFEEKMLKKIITTVLEKEIVGDNKKDLLLALYYGLLAWEEQSAACHIRGVFSGFFKTQLAFLIAKKHIIAMPEKFANYIKGVVFDLTLDNPELVSLPSSLVNYNFYELENLIIKAAYKKNADSTMQYFLNFALSGGIIAGKQIIFVSANVLPRSGMGKPLVTNLGLKSLLFVPNDFLINYQLNQYNALSSDNKIKVQKKIAGDIASLYSYQPLVSTNSQFGIDASFTDSDYLLKQFKAGMVRVGSMVPNNLIKFLTYIFSKKDTFQFTSLGLDGQELDFVDDEYKKIAAVANNYTANLSSKIIGLSIFATMLPSIRLLGYVKNNGKKTFNDSIICLINALFGLYDNYYCIEEKDVLFCYGSNHSYSAIRPDLDIPVEKAYDILAFFEQNNKFLFDKLVNFIIEDHVFQTSLQEREKDFFQKKLYQPSLLSNTPLSLITLLAEKIGFITAKACLESSRTPEELIITAYILLNPLLANNFKNSDNDKQMSLLVDYLIAHYIREKLPKDQVLVLLSQFRPLSNFSNRIALLNKQPFIADVIAYLKGMLINNTDYFVQAHNIAQSNLEGHELDCYLSQLMQAYCSGNELLQLVKSGNISEIADEISKFSPGFAHDKIMQAVESGSERSSIQAATIECVQNSVDAIKNFTENINTALFKDTFNFRTIATPSLSVSDHAAMLTQIDIHLGYLPCLSDKTQSHFLLSITDSIGMPNLKTLLTDLIVPDYSTKSPALGSIGVMGNGFFQIYKAATSVTVVTRLLDNPSKIYCLVITPQRNNHGFVVDLKIQCTNIAHLENMTDFYGTSIRILFKPENHEKNTVFNFLAAKNFLRSCVGTLNVQTCCNTKKEFIRIYSTQNESIGLISRKNKMGELLNEQIISSQLLNQAHSQEGFAITIYQRANSLLQSYVLTGGIPFMPLAVLAKEMRLFPDKFLQEIESGLIVDIPSALYNPVQSRAHLKMNETTIQLLRKELLEAFYLYMLRRGKVDISIFNNLFTHFSSEYPDLKQLSLSNYLNVNVQSVCKRFIESGYVESDFCLENFFTYYKPQLVVNNKRVKSFYEHIQESFNFFIPLITKIKEEANNKLQKCIIEAKNNVAIDSASAAKVRIDFDHCIINITNDSYKQLMQQLSVWENQIKAECSGDSDLIEYVVIPWVSKKIKMYKFLSDNVSFDSCLQKNILDKVPELKTREENEKDKKGLVIYERLLEYKPLLQKTLDIFLVNYCALFIQLSERSIILNGAEWTIEPISRFASFCTNSKKISVNLAAYTITDIFLLMTDLYNHNLDGLSRKSIYNKLFGVVVGSVGSVIHELEHAYRGTDHNVHGPATDVDGNQGVSFDACAVSTARKAIVNGLIEQWSLLFKKEVDLFHNKKFMMLIDDICLLERANKNLLLKLFQKDL